MAESLRDLVVSLSLNTDNFTRNINSVNKQIREAESYFKLASAGVKGFDTSAAGLSAKVEMLQRKLQLQKDAVGQYERALTAASAKLQECYTRQEDYAQRLADAKAKQTDLRAEVEIATVNYEKYRDSLGESDSATIAAKANMEAFQQELQEADAEVEKLSGQNDALKRSTQNAADAVSTAQTQLNRANAALDRSYRRGGVGGDILLGAALGPTFSSCSPTYALILATVLPVSFGEGLLYIVVYALGLAIALLLVAFLGQAFARKLGWLSSPSGWFRRVVGILLVIVGLAVILGLDKQFQAFVLEQGWYDPIQQFEEGITG